MCSIVGFIEKKKQAETEIIERMNKALSHRGPDDCGIMALSIFGSEYDNIAIGHNRLSIRDLSHEGHQPMLSYDNNIILTFNGEIYNADSFRGELKNSGYVFRGTSDTEVLLYLYEKYGIDEMLRKIDGMYAICIIDKKLDCIFLIRDKIGEKPLYYYQNDNVFMWASEYKAFYKHPSFKSVLDDNNLTEYFMFRYVAGGDTLLKNVINLKPGTYLKIADNTFSQYQYWDYPICERKFDLQEISVKEMFRDKLHKAFGSRLVSDVEVGIQLSGGVDSSCLTEYVSRSISDKVKTFGIIFENGSYSEKKYMDQVTEKCGNEPYMYILSDDMFLESWLKTTYYFEAPMNHEGTLGLYHLNKYAAEKIKVILCGEGADESMGGYSRFYDILRFAEKNRYDINAESDLFNNDIVLKFIGYSQFVGNDDVKKIYHDCRIDDVLQKRTDMIKRTRGTGMRKLMNYEISTYCQDLLMRADKISMASSLEQRVPYLAPELIEFENSIPDEYFVSLDSEKSARNTKKILKEYCAGLFDEEFTYRPKMGFGYPLAEYFARTNAREYLEDVVLPCIKKRGILNYDYIMDLYYSKCSENVDFTRGNDSEVNALWTTFSFEIWAQMYLDGALYD